MIIEGRMNPNTGNPEILIDGEVVDTSIYQGIAAVVVNGILYIVITNYFEGKIPSEYIGVLLKVEK
jgi:hypothetical protein